MALFRRDREPVTPDAPVVVASAQAVEVSDYNAAQELALTRQPWQARAWGYFDTVGELHFAGKYIGNALSKIRLIGAEHASSATDAPQETTNKAVAEAVAKLKSPAGGQGGLMRNMGLNVFIAGECFLLGKEDKDGKQQWEALSINEVEIHPGEKVPYRKKSPMDQPRPVEPGTLVVRVWSPHPRYSFLADSAVRTILDECEKLLLLTRADKAAARSRFAGAGLLFIPNELMPAVQQPIGSDVGDAAENPIYKNLIDSMITPIRDEQHPAGVVPITIFGPGEYGDKIRYLTFDRPQASRAQQQREESITRIATALDLPAEILTGKAALNHWAAWQVHEETFSQHLQPLVELICDALTVGYLQPALEQAGVADADKYLIWYDDSALVVRPDKGQTAAALYESNVINAAAYRRETGFAEEDVMEDEEYAKRVGVLLGDVQLALTGKPTEQQPGEQPTPNGPQVGGDRPTLQEKMTPPDAIAKPRDQAQRQGTPTTEKPMDGKPQKPPVTAAASPQVGSRRGRHLGLQLARLDVELMTQLRTAASEVMIRELERAGARIRSRVRNNPLQHDVIADAPNHLVASILGPSLVASLDLTDEELLSGAFSAFGVRAGMMLTAAQKERLRLLRQRLAAESVDFPEDLDETYGETDDGNMKTAVAFLSAGLLALAIEKLWKPGPDTAPPGEGEFDGLLVPATLVRNAVAAAGGADVEDGVVNFEAGGIGTGITTQSILREAGIETAGYQWVYGPAIRVPFSSHEDLDGEEFTSWDDEVLAVRDEDAWLGVDHYKPGDHWGCLCSVAPLLSIDVSDGTAAEDDSEG